MPSEPLIFCMASRTPRPRLPEMATVSDTLIVDGHKTTTSSAGDDCTTYPERVNRTNSMQGNQNYLKHLVPDWV